MNTSSQLHDKTIVIAGAAGRIGHVLVEAALNARAKVVALDTNAQGLEALKAHASADYLDVHAIDMNDGDTLLRIFENAHERFGGLDGAINCAYPRNANYGRHFFDVAYEDFCENAGLHMGAYFLFMQTCTRYARDQRHPFSLVNFSSMYGSLVPRFDVYKDTAMTMSVEYAAIKAGIEHMTRYANAYVKGTDIPFRANCVSPGGILDNQDPKFLESYRSHCMSKGMLDSADIVGTVLFFLSDQSRYVAGQNILVDDGFSL